MINTIFEWVILFKAFQERNGSRRYVHNIFLFHYLPQYTFPNENTVVPLQVQQQKFVRGRFLSPLQWSSLLIHWFDSHCWFVIDGTANFISIMDVSLIQKHIQLYLVHCSWNIVGKADFLHDINYYFRKY